MTAESFVIQPNDVVSVTVSSSILDVTTPPATPYSVILVQGPQGPQGPPRAAFIYTQSTAAATWTVTHTLGFVPNNAEITIGGEVVDADIEFPDNTAVVITCATPQAGVLRLT
jgi:hypothetical protein